MLSHAINQLADVGPLHQSDERQADALGPVGDEPGPCSASLYLLLPSLTPLSNFPPSLFCPSLLHNTRSKMSQLFFDNTLSFRSQQLLLFNATLNPNSTSDYFLSSFVQLQVCLFHACDSLMAFWWPKKTIAPSKNELSDPLDGSGGENFPTSNKITYNKIRWPFPLEGLCFGTCSRDILKSRAAVISSAALCPNQRVTKHRRMEYIYISWYFPWISDPSCEIHWFFLFHYFVHAFGIQ